MTKIIIWVLVIGIVWLIQTILTLKQVKKFNIEMRELQKLGVLSIGKYKGMFFSGCIVMIATKDNIIQAGKILEGFTVFSKVKNFDMFNGLKLIEVQSIIEDLNLTYSRKKALLNILQCQNKK